MKWTVPMPRERAPAGMANVALGYRRSDGLRMEFVGKLTEQQVDQLMLTAIEMSKENRT